MKTILYHPIKTILAMDSFSRLVGLLFLLGIILRVIGLSLKPPHFDEGINWFFTQHVLRDGFYTYDPHNYHGPLHFYLLALIEMIFESEVWNYRLVTAFFSILSFVFLFFSRSYLGKTAVFAACFFAISPALTFYARYAIHESEFVFFLILIFYGLLHLAHQRSEKGFYIFLAGFTGCLLTKETFIIHFAVILFSLVSLAFLHNTFALNVWKNLKSIPKPFLLTVSATMCLILFVVFTGGFQNLSGAKDFFAAYMFWITDEGKGLDTSGGHVKYSWYWLELFIRYEWPILLGVITACILLIFAMFSRYLKEDQKQFFRSLKGAFLVFLSLYALLVLLIYSIIPYKTPWCVISIAWPFLLTLGWGLEKCLLTETIAHAKNILQKPVTRIAKCLAFVQRIPLQKSHIAIFILLILICFSMYQAISVNFIRYDDNSHKYVYVQTKRDYWDFCFRMNILIRKYPEAFKNHSILILTEHTNYWPLPWALSSFQITYLHLPSEELAENVGSKDIQKTPQQRFSVQLDQHSMIILESSYIDIMKQRVAEIQAQVDQINQSTNQFIDFKGFTYHRFHLNDATGASYVLMFSKSLLEDMDWWDHISLYEDKTHPL